MSFLKGPDHPEPLDRHECMDPSDWNPPLPLPLLRTLQVQSVLGLPSRSPVKRRKREAVPPEKKDDAYVSRRRKNNEAAKRSREKRRMKDLLLEGQLLALSNQNARLQDQVLRLWHLSMRAEKGNAAPGRNLCPAYTPAVPKPPICAEKGRNPGDVSPFSWIQSFAPLPQSSDRFPLCGPHLPSAAAEMERSVDSGMEARVTADFKADSSSVGAFQPRPDALHPAAVSPYPPPPWLAPSPAVGSSFLLPWLPPYPASVAPYPSMPSWVQETQSQSFSLGGDVFKGHFYGTMTHHF